MKMFSVGKKIFYKHYDEKLNFTVWYAWDWLNDETESDK